MRRARALTAVVVAAAATTVSLAVKPVLARANETVWACGAINAGGQNKVFTGHGVPGIDLSNSCASGGAGLSIDAPTNTVAYGRSANWSAEAPPGLQIVLAYVDPPNLDAYSGGAYELEFFWAGGYRSVAGISAGSFGVPGLHTSYFGFSATCLIKPTCNGFAHLAVSDIGLQAQETQPPYLLPASGLWQASGYIRGDWPLYFNGDSPSGVCTLSASLNGQAVALAGFPQNDTIWHQCNATGVSSLVHTDRFSDGAGLLTIRGADAAGVTTPDSFYSKAVYIDNRQPGISFAGSPTDVPSSAGTQYINVTGIAGVSGISQVRCSLDDAPWQTWPQSSVQVRVSGVGVHHLTCTSSNRAKDPSGVVRSSAPQTWTLSIRQPTVSAIGFSHLIDRLRCHRVRQQVRIPGGWMMVRRHHKLVRIHRRPGTKTVATTRCQARTERRRVSVQVTVFRHGKRLLIRRTRIVQVALPPHAVVRSSARVPYGHAVTVSGWLGTTGLTALGGQTVSVLSAPDDGQNRYTQAVVATTRPDGSWSARLPPGPSRLVLAAYAGGPVTEPTLSSQVHVIVPAKVRLISVTPRVAWGGTVRIVGQLQGGYLPPGGALVRLRIGQGSGYVTYGVQEHVTGNGRFTTTYTFGAGVSSVYRSYWFQIASLPMGNYPYASASSRRLSVTVGGHPPG